MAKAGKMKGKDKVLMMMQRKGKKANFIRLQNWIKSGRLWKGTNNGNTADGNIMQSSPKVGWITVSSICRADGLLQRK